MLASNDDRLPSISESLRLFVNKNRSIANCSNDGSKVAKHHGLKYHVNAEQAKENIQFLAQYAQHILPPLFSKFVELQTMEEPAIKDPSSQTSPEKMRCSVLETIKAWVFIADINVVNRFFETTLKKFIAAEQESDGTDATMLAQKHALLDLTLAILASQRIEVEAVQVLSRVLLMGIQNTADSTTQKKCYRALCLLFEHGTVATMEDEELLGRAQAIDAAFWSNPEFLQELADTMLQSSISLGNAAKKDRLVLMHAIVSCIRWDPLVKTKWEKVLGLIPAAITEAILGTKEVNERARNAAYDLLMAMGRKLQELGRDSDGAAMLAFPTVDEEESTESSTSPANLDEFIKIVTAGLAGKSPHMISATIVSLARLIFEFHEDLDSDMVHDILQVVIVYATQSKSREIIKAAISFVKVAIIVCADLIRESSGANEQGDIAMDVDADTAEHGKYNFLKAIIEALLKWTSEHKSHFKVPCRYIIERMVRKFGHEQIELYFPEEHHKLLTNIRKIRERKARKAAATGSTTNGAATTNPSFQDLMKDHDNSDADDEGPDDQDDQDDMPEILRELVGAMPPLSGGKGASGRVRIREGDDDMDDEPVDFLDRKAVSKLHTHSAATKSKKNAGKSTVGKTPQSEDGRWIFEDSEEEKEKEPAMTAAESSLAKAARAAHTNYMEAIQSKDGFTYSGDGKRLKFAGNKRSRDEEEPADDFDATNDVALDADDQQPKQHRPRNKQDKYTKKRRTAEKELGKAGVRSVGKEFRSKKGRGDVKRPGGPDPFAYIPLHPKIVASKKGKKNVSINKKLFGI